MTALLINNYGRNSAVPGDELMENGITIERLKEKQRPIAAMKSDEKGYTVGSNKIEICKLEKRSPDDLQ